MLICNEFGRCGERECSAAVSAACACTRHVRSVCREYPLMNQRVEPRSGFGTRFIGDEPRSGIRESGFGIRGAELSEEETVSGVIRLDRIFVTESFEERSKGGQVVLVDLEADEHAAEVGSVIAVVEEADVPPSGERVQKVRERAGTLGKFEPAE